MTADQKEKMYKRLMSPAFWVALLGAAKLVSNAFGITIDDAQVNAISNGFATMFALVGIAVGYGEG